MEFLYVGHYQTPSPTQPPDIESESIISEDGTYQQGIDTPTTSQSVRPGMAQCDNAGVTLSDLITSPVGPRPLTPLWRFGLEHRNHSNPFTERDSLEVLGLRSCNPAMCGYGEVLLAHAKVYSLAQNQEVEALRKLACRRLLSTLLSIGEVEPDCQVVVDLIDLLRYVYSHTVPSESSEEPLQNIVSQFAALNFPALQSRDEMTGLMQEGGKLASDLMKKVCKRLVSSEGLLQAVPTPRAEVQGMEEAVKDTEQENTEPPDTERGNSEQGDIKEEGTKQRDKVKGTKVSPNGQDPEITYLLMFIASFLFILLIAAGLDSSSS